MLEDLWDGALQLLSQFVIPDWGALISLLPIGIFVLIVLVTIRTIWRLWRAAPPRRGKQRIEPRPPAGVHMPGPSLAPFFAAFGAFLLFLGLVFGGPILILGIVALVLTLLYWFAEALRIYRHDVGDTTPDLPVVVHTGPPPGVHMPGPSFRPFLAALGATLLMLGLVFGEWLLLIGFIALVLTLAGWLVDARREYVKTVEADSTGHLENIPPPKAPSRLLAVITVLVVAGVAIQVGWIPPRQANGGESATPSGAPAPGGSGGPAASGGPGGPGAPAGSGGSTAGGGDVTILAKDVAFDRTTLAVPAGKAFRLEFVNDDSGVPHNVELKDATGAEVFKGEIFNGPGSKVYDVPSLPAGSYTFLCIVHPSMTGTATAQ